MLRGVIRVLLVNVQDAGGQLSAPDLTSCTGVRCSDDEVLVEATNVWDKARSVFFFCDGSDGS